MALKDYEFVNFSESYELDYHLRIAEKRQTDGNRKELRKLGDEFKKKAGVGVLTHFQLRTYMKDHLHRFE